MFFMEEGCVEKFDQLRPQLSAYKGNPKCQTNAWGGKWTSKYLNNLRSFQINYKFLFYLNNCWIE